VFGAVDEDPSVTKSTTVIPEGICVDISYA
jgi:hypothetical protein